MNARAMGHRELTVGLWALSHVRQCPAQLTCTLNLRRSLRRTGCLNSNQACLFICLFFFSLDGTGVAIGWIIDSTCSRTQWCSLRLLRCAACACSDVLPAHAHLLVIFSRHACFLFRDSLVWPGCLPIWLRDVQFDHEHLILLPLTYCYYRCVPSCLV